MKSRNGKPRRERIKEIKEKEDRREKEKKRASVWGQMS